MSNTNGYPILTESEQLEAYQSGYREGTLVKLGYIRISEDIVNSVGDFPIGCWSQQSSQGYIDGAKGFPVNFLAWGVKRT